MTGIKMTYLSVCSGIEAASVAWRPLGWGAAGFSEIEPFPCAVLARRFPEVGNYGDMTRFREWDAPAFDVLVGGTPCQAFSVAGFRKGLDDPRGNLTLVFLGLVERFRPKYVVWENVPGVLSDRTGAFAAFLSGLAELGYVFDADILDAQDFGVPQRRRRVFVVAADADYINGFGMEVEDEGPADGWLFDTERVPPGGGDKLRQARRAVGAVLGPGGFGRGRSGGVRPFAEGVRGASAPRGAAGAGASGGVAEGAGGAGGAFAVVNDQSGGFLRVEDGRVSPTLLSKSKSHAPIVVALAGKAIGRAPGNGGNGRGWTDGPMFTLTRTDVHAVFVDAGHSKVSVSNDVSGALTASDRTGDKRLVYSGGVVRRVTPVECERLQGFPDGWTDVPWRGKEHPPDSLRYAALGNSMAVPCMRFIGERIQALDDGLRKAGACHV